MKRFVWIFAGLTFALPAAAQDSVRPAADSRAMYQDVEVMGAILVRRVVPNCTSCHGDPFAGGNSFMSSGMGAMGGSAGVGGPGMGGGAAISNFDSDGRLDIFLANHPHGNSIGLGSVEGAYFRGQGVIFQATVPPVPAKELKLSGTTQSPKSLSDWEKTLLQIRGEKATTTAHKPQGTLADKLLKSLAENGKNFTRLPENENLTIVVTFRGGRSTGESGAGQLRARHDGRTRRHGAHDRRRLGKSDRWDADGALRWARRRRFFSRLTRTDGRWCTVKRKLGQRGNGSRPRTRTSRRLASKARQLERRSLGLRSSTAEDRGC